MLQGSRGCGDRPARTCVPARHRRSAATPACETIHPSARSRNASIRIDSIVARISAHSVADTATATTARVEITPSMTATKAAGTGARYWERQGADHATCRSIRGLTVTLLHRSAGAGCPCHAAAGSWRSIHLNRLVGRARRHDEHGAGASCSSRWATLDASTPTIGEWPPRGEHDRVGVVPPGRRGDDVHRIRGTRGASRSRRQTRPRGGGRLARGSWPVDRPRPRGLECGRLARQRSSSGREREPGGHRTAPRASSAAGNARSEPPPSIGTMIVCMVQPLLSLRLSRLLLSVKTRRSSRVAPWGRPCIDSGGNAPGLCATNGSQQRRSGIRHSCSRRTPPSTSTGSSSSSTTAARHLAMGIGGALTPTHGHIRRASQPPVRESEATGSAMLRAWPARPTGGGRGGGDDCGNDKKEARAEREHRETGVGARWRVPGRRRRTRASRTATFGGGRAGVVWGAGRRAMRSTPRVTATCRHGRG